MFSEMEAQGGVVYCTFPADRIYARSISLWFPFSRILGFSRQENFGYGRDSPCGIGSLRRNGVRILVVPQES